MKLKRKSGKQRKQDTLARMNRLRENEEYRDIEKVSKRLARIKRKFDDSSAEDRVFDCERKKRLRCNVDYHLKEKEANSNARKIAREDACFRMEEQISNTNARRLSRSNPEIKERDACNLSKSRNGTLESNLKDFLRKSREGPTFVCVCCGGLWFETSMKTLLTLSELSLVYEKKFLEKVLFVEAEDGYRLCGTCHRDFKLKKVPRLALSNGLDFPVIPTVLEGLTSLEERMCSLRLPFLQIRSLGVDKQCGVKGNVVHIANDLDVSVCVLPRTMDLTSIIPVQLFRHMDHEKPYLSETIRPFKVFEAAKYLLNTPVYKEEGATLSLTWLQGALNCQEQNESASREILANVDEEELDANPGSKETMILQAEPEMIKIAPGQGKTPLSLLMDLNAEAAAYPTIYGGQKRVIPDIISPIDLWKSETRRYDRRCAIPHKVLHAYKLSQNYQVSRAISICLRKKKGKKVTALQMLNEESVRDLITHDHGFRLLKDVRTSPAYWEGKSKHTFAMIRQLGIPTLFLTLSAAEAKWGELLSILKKVLDSEVISVEEALQMPYEDKASLIRRDPVTCSRYFDYRLRSCFNILFKRAGGIFHPYKLRDYFWRIEFQHRGSPHAHMLIWLDGAPQYNENNSRSVDECVKFIDKLICCNSSEEGVIYQQHRHTKTCKRETKEGDICRFQIPYPPMPETKIIAPLPGGFPADVRKAMKAKLAKVKQYLEENKKSPEDIDFETFLRKMELGYKEYILALRCSIKRPTVFLRRNTASCFTNAFIANLGRCWKANMDVQFILDPFGCAQYVCSYITKSCGGVSKLMKAAADQVKSGDLSIKEKMRKFGNVFLNGVEVSAQEASYGVLGMRLTNSSRDCVFIPTGPPEERVMFIKSKEELMRLEEDSTEIAASGLLEHYMDRPEVLEEMCLAEFASEYTYSRRKPWKIAEVEADDDVHDSGEEDEDIPTVLALLNKTGFIRKRRLGRVIRFRRYGEKEDLQNYLREQLMLYVPWRDEESELIDIDHEQRFKEVEELVSIKRKAFNTLEHDLSSLAFEEEDSEEENEIDEQYAVMEGFEQQSDIMAEVFLEREKSKSERFPIPRLMDNEQYIRLIQRLNYKQEQYMCHVVDALGNGTRLTNYIYGGAGVGKSALIECIVQAVLRLELLKPGVDVSTCKVLLAAPTGQAAFNIKGTTLHNAFLLPLNQFTGNLPKLSDDMCNSLSCQLKDCKLVIIDEISMVSCTQLYQVSSRMQQIFKDSRSFGGKSVLLFGDLRQLRPVGASPIYSDLKGELGAIVGNPLWEEFQSFELTEIMRQKDDAVFAEALNRMARGCMTNEDVLLFKSREITTVGDPSKQCLRLFKDNRSVTDYNNKALDLIKEESVTATANDICQGKGKPEWKEALRDSVQSLSTAETMGLPLQTRLVVSARYMLTLNLDVPDGLVNGSLGVLDKISYAKTGGGKTVPFVAWIKFSPDDVGVKRRKFYRKLCPKEATKEVLTPVMIEKRVIKTWPGRNLQCIRSQFPLVPAEAMTIHKSQGSSHDQVVVNVSKGLTKAALYVACSRARTLSGLFIEGNFEAPKLQENDKTEAEISRVKSREIVFAEYLNPKNFVLTATKIVLPVTITDEPLRKVFVSINSPSCANPLVTSVGRFQVYSADIDSLKPTAWISDAIIDSYLEVLCTQNQLLKCHNFGSFFRHYLLKFEERFDCNRWKDSTEASVMFVPICRNDHWTLVFADRRTKFVRMLDSKLKSVGLRDLDIANRFREFLNLTDLQLKREGVWNVCEKIACPQQNNGYDCGAFLCKYVECITLNKEFDFGQDSMNLYRIIVRNRLLYRI